MSSTIRNHVQLETVQGIMERIAANKKVKVSLGILSPLILVSLFASYIVPHDPTASDMANQYAGLGGEYLLGTDHLGRDLLSRVIMGGRVSLFIGMAATGLALTLGVPIGLTAGYTKGKLDELLMRLMDMLMSIPTILLGILLLAILPNNMWTVIFAVGVVYTPLIARVVRSATLSISEEEYILAAKVRGESHLYIMFREILPNIMSPILVEGTVRIGFAILAATSLSFLGLGSQPPHPDWGYMISESRYHIWETPWSLVWPSIALSLTVLAFNLLGDGLRVLLDPVTEEKTK